MALPFAFSLTGDCQGQEEGGFGDLGHHLDGLSFREKEKKEKEAE